MNPKRSLHLLAPCALCLLFFCGCAPSARAQDNYEIQVYGSETVAPRTTMVELHSNYTIDGSKQVIDGVQPTNHAWHETVEITHGFNAWFETGFYLFTSIQSSGSWYWVGDHIRPRARVPASWHWPVGASLSMEIGYQRPSFSSDTWTLELRPIIDKELGHWYLSFNPTLDRSLAGANAGKGFEFSPNFKFSYHVSRTVDAGLEYYGALGPITGFDSLENQQHQIVPAIDLNVSPDWELNFGVGIGVTHSTDHLLVKMILGRRFKA
jgi:hypothetical protein